MMKGDKKGKFVSVLLAGILLVANDVYSEIHRFSLYDFQIVENYIQMNRGESNSRQENTGRNSNFFDEYLGVTFEEVKSRHGWKAIRIASHNNQALEYFLNYEPRNQATDSCVTILTTACGSSCDDGAMRHFTELLYALKRHLLVGRNTNLLAHYLQSRKGDRGAFGDGDKCRFLYEIRWVDNERYITITPCRVPSELPVSYTIKEKIKRNRSIVSWWYEGEDHEMDDYFFKHFSTLLIEAQSSDLIAP